MTLWEAQEKLKEFEAEEIYWNDKKQLIESIVMPKAINPTCDVVDGGKRVDKMLLYVEQLDEQQVIETLEYIKKEIKLLKDLINKLSKIRDEYPTLEKKIYDLRHDVEYKRTHNKPMPFWKIGKIVGYSKNQCRLIYNKIVQNKSK